MEQGFRVGCSRDVSSRREAHTPQSSALHPDLSRPAFPVKFNLNLKPYKRLRLHQRLRYLTPPAIAMTAVVKSRGPKTAIAAPGICIHGCRPRAFSPALAIFSGLAGPPGTSGGPWSRSSGGPPLRPRPVEWLVGSEAGRTTAIEIKIAKK